MGRYRRRSRNQLNTRDLLIAGAVLCSLVGLPGVAAWLLQSAIITPEVKGLLFFGWLVGIAASLPHPLDEIAFFAILIGIAVIGVSGYLLLGRVWYMIHAHLH